MSREGSAGVVLAFGELGKRSGCVPWDSRGWGSAMTGASPSRFWGSQITPSSLWKELDTQRGEGALGKQLTRWSKMAAADGGSNPGLTSRICRIVWHHSRPQDSPEIQNVPILDQRAVMVR